MAGDDGSTRSTRNKKSSTSTTPNRNNTSSPSLQKIMDALNSNQEYMEKQFSKLDQKLNNVLIRVEKLEQKQGEYEKSLNFYGEQITDLQKQLKAIREVGAVKENEEGEMRKTVSRLQQDKNLRILRISGIPTSTHENLSYMMTKIADIMKINDFNSSSDIENIYRVKPKDSNNKSPVIIVKFNSLLTRDQFYEGRKILSQVTTIELGFSVAQKIYVNEYLSPETQKLFYLARQKRSELGYRYVWTYHNVIYMRKVKEEPMLKVTSEETLNQLE